jgi:hypothetical protein
MNRFALSLVLAATFLVLILGVPAAAFAQAPGCPADPTTANLAQALNPACEVPWAAWVVDIWRLSMSVVNVAVVLMIIVAALATILHWNIDTYGVKKALPAVVIAVVLANFSLLIVRGLVDLASILTQTFAGNTRELADGIVMAILGGATAPLSGIIGYPLVFFLFGGISILLSLLGAILAVLIPAIGILILWFLLFIRVSIVLVFAAVSPLAFMAMAFPATQPFFRRWWGIMLSWIFMAPVVFLLLRIGSAVGRISVANMAAGGGFVSVILPFVIALGALALAIMAPFKMGGAIAAAGGAFMGFIAGTRAGGWSRKIAEPFLERGRLQREALYAKTPLGTFQKRMEIQRDVAKEGVTSAWEAAEDRVRGKIGERLEQQRRMYELQKQTTEELRKQNVLMAMQSNPALEHAIGRIGLRSKILADRVENSSKDTVDTVAGERWRRHQAGTERITDPVEMRRIRSMVESRTREDAKPITDYVNSDVMEKQLTEGSTAVDANDRTYRYTREMVGAFLRQDYNFDSLQLENLTDEQLEAMGTSRNNLEEYKGRINREIESSLLGMHGKLERANLPEHADALRAMARIMREHDIALPKDARFTLENIEQVTALTPVNERREMARLIRTVIPMGRANRPAQYL